jgi:hypothetical protein
LFRQFEYYRGGLFLPRSWIRGRSEVTFLGDRSKLAQNLESSFELLDNDIESGFFDSGSGVSELDIGRDDGHEVSLHTIKGILPGLEIDQVLFSILNCHGVPPVGLAIDLEELINQVHHLIILLTFLLLLLLMGFLLDLGS